MNHRLQAKHLGVLNTMPAATRNRLFGVGTIRERKKGEILYGASDEMQNIVFVLEGYVALYRNSREGEERVFFICSGGELINEVVVQKERSTAAARALSDVKLLCIPRGIFVSLMQEDFGLVCAVMESLSRKARRLYHQLSNVSGTNPLEKKMASKLWKLARDYGVDIPSEGGVIAKEIPFDVSVTFLSSMLGVKRESASRAISKMKADGLILYESKHLIVPDLEKVRELGIH